MFTLIRPHCLRVSAQVVRCFRLKDQLRALWRFMLLGDGLFLQRVIDGAEECSAARDHRPGQPASEMQALSLRLSHITASMAEDYPDASVSSDEMLKHFSYRYDPGRGGLECDGRVLLMPFRGWTTPQAAAVRLMMRFRANYHIEADSPLFAVLSAGSLERYSALHSYLLLFPHLEKLLTRCWLDWTKKTRRLASPTCDVTTALLQQMRFVVVSLSEYFRLMVVMPAWKQLSAALLQCEGDSSTASVTALARAHTAYVDRIWSQCWLDEATADVLATLESLLGQAFDLVSVFPRQVEASAARQWQYTMSEFIAQLQALDTLDGIHGGQSAAARFLLSRLDGSGFWSRQRASAQEWHRSQQRDTVNSTEIPRGNHADDSILSDRGIV